MILAMIIPMQLVMMRTWSSTFLLVAVTTLVTSHSEAPKFAPTFNTTITITIFTALYHDSQFKTKCKIIFNTSKVTALAAWITSLATYWLIFQHNGGEMSQKEKNLSMTVASVRRSSGGSLHIVEVTLINSNANNYLWKNEKDTSILLSSTPLPSLRGFSASCTSAVHNLMSVPCTNNQQFIWLSFAVKPKIILL